MHLMTVSDEAGVDGTDPASAASALAARLADDVGLAMTRAEHLRLTARAYEARRLADELAALFRTGAGPASEQ